MGREKLIQRTLG